MQIKRLVVMAVVFLGMQAFSQNPYQKASLNPVTFSEPEKHAPLQFIKEGKLNFVLVRDMQAEKEIKQPAWRSLELSGKALQDAFELVYGLRPEIVDAASERARQAPLVLAFGASVLTEELALQPLALPKEGFLLRSFSRGLVVAGHDGSLIPGSYDKFDWSRYRLNGTLNGVYDFIERFLGVRYYYPGIGVVAPKADSLSIEPVCYTDSPRFRNRYNWAFLQQFRSGLPWKGVKNDAASFDKVWRLAMSTRFNDVCHTPDPSMLAKAYPDLIPELFYRDRNGHQYYNPATHIGNLLDITSPKLTEVLVEAAKRFYESGGAWRAPWHDGKKGWYPPNSEYLLFGQADTFALMENEQNKHLFPEERRNSRSGALSDLYANFYIELANRLKEELPGIKLGALAYHQYTLPPLVRRDFPDNVRVQVCMGRIVMAKSASARKQWLETYKGWNEVLKHPVSCWLYGAQGTAFTKAIQGPYIQDFLQLLDPYLWEDGMMYDASGLQWNFYYSYYPLYRCLWNPSFNVQAALHEHWELLYGAEAGELLSKFYQLLVDRWEKVYIPAVDQDASGRANSNTTPDLLYKAYDLSTVEQLEKLLQAALAATEPNSIERQRVEFFAQPWAKDFTAARAYCTLVIPSYEVKQLPPGKNIVVDGRASEEEWKLAERIEMQDARGGGQTLNWPPEARLLWNQKGIYLLYSLPDKPSINPGDIFFASDHIEFFLSPGTDKETYCQFAISAGADLFDAFRRLKPIETSLDKNWSCPGLELAVAHDEKSWSLEVFIPFSGLQIEPPKPYQVWFGNLISTKQPVKDRQQAGEYSAYSLTMGNNHNFDLFGKFKFIGQGD